MNTKKEILLQLRTNIRHAFKNRTSPFHPKLIDDVSIGGLIGQLSDHDLIVAENILKAYEHSNYSEALSEINKALKEEPLQPAPPPPKPLHKIGETEPSNKDEKEDAPTIARKSKQQHKKGRPANIDREADASIAQSWERTKDAGITKTQFADDINMSIDEVDRALDRVRKR